MNLPHRVKLMFSSYANFELNDLAAERTFCASQGLTVNVYFTFLYYISITSAFYNLN